MNGILFCQNTWKTGNNAAEMSQVCHDITRFEHFTDLNLFLSVQCHSKLGNVSFTILFVGAYFLLAVIYGRRWIAERSVNAVSLLLFPLVWLVSDLFCNKILFIPFTPLSIKITRIIVFILHFLKSVMQGHVHLRAVSLDSS